MIKQRIGTGVVETLGGNGIRRSEAVDEDPRDPASEGVWWWSVGGGRSWGTIGKSAGAVR